MTAMAALRRDIRTLSPAHVLIVTLAPLGAFALGLIAIFPARFFA